MDVNGDQLPSEEQPLVAVLLVLFLTYVGLTTMWTVVWFATRRFGGSPGGEVLLFGRRSHKAMISTSNCFVPSLFPLQRHQDHDPKAALCASCGQVGIDGDGVRLLSGLESLRRGGESLMVEVGVFPASAFCCPSPYRYTSWAS